MSRFNINNLVTIFILFVLYFMFNFYFFTSDTYLIIFGFQLLFALVSISPIGSFILRLLWGCKELNNKQKERLLPIFEEVYKEVKKEYPNINKNIKLYVENNLDVNAFAVGGNTIVLTKGAIDTFSDEELKGIIAHEFAHIMHGDTFLLLFLLIGNSIILFFFLLGKFFQGIMYLTRELINTESMHITYKAITFLASIIFSLALLIVGAILMINQKSNEYKADKLAFKVGYGENITTALYQLQDFDFGGSRSIMERIKASHPNISNRINRLENMV